MTDEARKKTANIILIVLGSMILLGVLLTVYFMTADKSVIKVSIDPDEAQEIQFKNLELRPGESDEYTLILSSRYSNAYEVSLSFSESEPIGTLKSYVYVKIEKDGETLCDRLLSDVLEDETIKLDADFSDGAENEVRLTYYMPADVGNEAQNTEANFLLLVTAKN